EEGIDYTDVFAPVARLEAIRLFLAFASFIGFKVYQMDVKSAFLYGKIAEEVYVTQPRGFEDPDHPKKVYKVVKALYGIHQAPRAWHQVTPKTSHLLSVKRIFKFLTAYPKLGLWYPHDSPFDLESFSDSDYAGAHGDRKSTTGGCQFLGRRYYGFKINC
nr:putative ribonuclease H-like domain-containing protein [Tanacetum cinerariifolium]